jgi:hypothetical protein
LKLKDLHSDVMNLEIQTQLPNISQDNFCLDMGTTPLATERLRAENMDQNMNLNAELQLSKNSSNCSEEIDKQMFKKNIKLKDIMNSSYEGSDQEMILNKKSYEQVSNEEIESQLAELQKSFEQIIPDSIKKKEKKKKKRKRGKNTRKIKKSKTGWSKPKKLMRWNSKDSKRNKNQFEIEEVFNNNRKDFGESEQSMKDKLSNCMCKAF